MTYKWLSYPLSTSSPRPPAIPAPSITEFMSIEKTGANVQFLQCYNHTGTHLDTAAHVIEGGISIAQFTPADLIFDSIMVIDLSGTLEDTVVTSEHLVAFMSENSDAEALIVKFGVEGWRQNDPKRFSNHCPGFSPKAAKYIHGKMPKLRLIGTDVPSIACINSLDETMMVHNEFFLLASLEKFIIVEEMKLDTSLSDIRRIIVSPWLAEEMNSGPCVIWAEYQE